MVSLVQAPVLLGGNIAAPFVTVRPRGACVRHRPAREGTTERHIRMALPLAFLAPDVVRAALDGRLPEGHGVSKLLACAHLSWGEQRIAVGLWL